MANQTGNIIAGIFLATCIAYSVYAQNNLCTTVGRFPVADDTTCQNYTYCVLAANNSFLAYNYVCPTTSVFNPTTRLCTAPANYACNVTQSVCTAEGFVADPAVTDCSSYIQCIQNGAAFTQTTLTCPANTFYNPTTTFCEATYTCPTAANPNTFSCTSVGRFPNTTDTTCQTYIMCVQATNGTFFQYQYTCPTTSVFSPASRLCTTTYTCPT